MPQAYASDPKNVFDALGSLPSGIVNSTVNVINGGYIEQHEDISLPGIEGLTLSRTNVKDSDDIIAGWVTNHRHVIWDIGEGLFKQFVDATYSAPHGMMFRFKKADDVKHISLLKIPDSRYLNGLTNTGKGAIGGKTNYRNLILQQRNKKLIEIRDGAGEIVTMRLRHEKFYPDTIEHSNRLFTKYRYDKKGRLSKIIGENRDAVTLSSITFNYPEKLEKDKSVVEAKTHNGQKVFYKFITSKQHGKKVLDTIINSAAPTIKYEYDSLKCDAAPRIQRRILPDDRILETFYYTRGDNFVCGKNEYQKKDGYSLNRVKVQKAPVGADSTLVTTHTYRYVKGKDYCGEAYVYDAYDRCKRYEYSRNKLYAISHYMGSERGEAPYLVEKFLWPNVGSSQDGNLIGHLISEDDTHHLAYRNFIYDERGNVKEDRLFGNLTGYSIEQIHLYGCYPIDNGVEVFVKRYTHSADGYNNMLSEDDGRKKIAYGYYPESDLLKEQLTYVGDRIAIRKFYFYDENRAVSKIIIDDGCHRDSSNLSGVTERHITEYRNHEKDIAGLPAEIEKKYLDLDTGTTITLTKKKIEYTPEGWVREVAEYDSKGSLISRIEKQYDNFGNVILEIDAGGYVIERRYDANKNKIYEKGPRQDMHREFGYDWSNRLVYQKEIYDDGTQLQESYSYDYLSNKISETDHFGNSVHYKYDTFGRVLEGTKRDGSILSKHRYNRLGHIVSKIDGKGNDHRVETTCRGQPVHIYYPDGTEEHCRYSIDGFLLEEVSKEGISSRFELDYLGRVIKESRYSRDGEFLDSRTYEYNAFHLIKEIDFQGKVTSYRYDYAGRLIQVENGERIKAIEYDDYGREIKVTEYASAGEYIATHKTYDALNRVISEVITDSEGNIQSAVDTRYDCDGNKVAITEYGKGGASTLIKEYNAHGEVIKEVDALGNTTITRYLYDYINDQGHRVGYRETIDPRGNKTMVIKDRCGRDEVLKREDAFGVPLHKTTFVYDGNDNKIASIEDVHLNGEVIRTMVNRWEYDAGNRLVKKIEAEGTPLQKEILASYNNLGQKASIVKPDGVIVSYAYNKKGLLQEVSSSDGTIDYSYHYDAMGNPIFVEDLANGTSTRRLYNQHGDVLEEILANGQRFGAEFDGLGRTQTIEHPDGLTVHYTYQGKFLKKVAAVDANGTETFSHSYVEYDQRGKLLEAQLAGNVGTASYDYDLLGRIRNITTEHWRENIAGFDESGNLTQKEVADCYGVTSDSYQYDAMNQLRKESGAIEHEYQNDSLNNRTSKDGVAQKINSLNQIVSDGCKQFYYDLNGNVVKIDDSIEEIQLQYDAFDRLIKVVRGDTTTKYTYDELHRRLTKNGESYLYNGKHEVGSVSPSGKIRERRFLGNAIAAEIGATVAMEIDDKLYVAIHDHNGNIATLVDAETNSIKEAYRFSAFGEEITESGSCINPWRFSGKRFDPETGFIYFGRRYYFPEIGRWLSADPLGDRDGVNLYAYVANNPLTHTDAFGLCRSCEVKNQMKQNNVSIFQESRPISFSQIANYGPSLDKADDKFLLYAAKNFKVLKLERVGDKPTPLGTMQLYANGIGTLFEKCIETAKKIADMSGGFFTYALCNPTEGGCKDLIKCAILKSHIDTQAVKELRGFLNFVTEELKKDCQDARLYSHHHSRAGMEMDRAGRGMPKDNRKHIQAHTYGSATMIDRGLFSYVMNYVNNLDGIPRTDLHGLYFNRDVVRYTNWSEGGIFNILGNHSIDSKGYMESIENEIFRYQKEEIWHR